MGRPNNCSCNCGTVVPPTDCAFTDDFASAGSGYTSYSYSGATVNFTVSGGKLVQDNSSTAASYYRQVSVNPSGLKTLSVQAKLYKPAGAFTGYVGVFIGSVRFMSRGGSPLVTTYGPCTATGIVTSSTSLGTGAADGDTFKIQLQETSTGVFQFTYYINGALQATESNVSLTTTSVFNVGVVGSLNDCSYDDLAIACDNIDDCLSQTMAVAYSVGPAPNVAYNPFAHPPCNSADCLHFRLPLIMYNAGGCVWTTADKFYCSINRWYWAMVVRLVGGLPYADLYGGQESPPVGSIGNLKLVQFSGYFNPLSSTTLPRGTGEVGCQNFPTTITVTPA